MGIIKAVITLVKYAPQARWIYIRKKTLGWSMTQVYMDFAGGVMSFLGIIFDGLALGKFEINYAKLGISCASQG